jgi:hypothetical protein
VNAGPGGHRGASHISSAAGSNPHTSTSDQPLPGPAPATLPAPERHERPRLPDHSNRPLDNRGEPERVTCPGRAGGLMSAWVHRGLC